MKQLIAYALIVTAIGTWAAALTLAQDDDAFEYAGTGDCRDCHRDAANSHRGSAHDLTLVEIEEDDDPEDNPIVADFSVGEDIRTVTFPDGDSQRPFTADDVAYTLGAGRHVQAYLYGVEGEDEDGDEQTVYYVLPAEWDVIEQTWKTLDLGGEPFSEAYAFGPNCAGCHVQELDTDDYDWGEDGVMCETCHGPGLLHVEAADDAGGSIDEEERAEILGSINIALDGQVCGQCHARGLATDGIHPYPVDYYPGQTLTDSFELYPPDDESHWWPTGHARLPNMQYNEMIVSAHPNALNSAQGSDNFGPDCLTCHSAASLRVDALLTDEEIDPETVDPLAVAEEYPLGVTCVSCHNPHIEVDEEAGETRPVANLRADDYTLCVTCHQDSDVTDGLHYPVREVYEGVTVIEQIDGVPSAHFTAEDGPTCSTCHMASVPTFSGQRHSHTFEIIPPGEALDLEELQDSCSGCHEETPVMLQQLIDDIQVDTRQRIETAQAALTDDAPAWVAVALDLVAGDGSDGIHNYAYTDTLLDRVEAELNLFETAEASE